jgi:hypothetical protein
MGTKFSVKLMVLVWLIVSSIVCFSLVIYLMIETHSLSDDIDIIKQDAKMTLNSFNEESIQVTNNLNEISNQITLLNMTQNQETLERNAQFNSIFGEVDACCNSFVYVASSYCCCCEIRQEISNAQLFMVNEGSSSGNVDASLSLTAKIINDCGSGQSGIVVDLLPGNIHINTFSITDGFQNRFICLHIVNDAGTHCMAYMSLLKNGNEPVLSIAV